MSFAGAFVTAFKYLHTDDEGLVVSQELKDFIDAIEKVAHYKRYVDSVLEYTLIDNSVIEIYNPYQEIVGAFVYEGVA